MIKFANCPTLKSLCCFMVFFPLGTRKYNITALLGFICVRLGLVGEIATQTNPHSPPPRSRGFRQAFLFAWITFMGALVLTAGFGRLWLKMIITGSKRL